MWSKGTVVIVTRGDASMANAIRKCVVPENTPVKDANELTRDCDIALVSHAAKLKKAMKDSEKYREPEKPMSAPVEVLVVGYAMAVCGIQAIIGFANKTSVLVKNWVSSRITTIWRWTKCLIPTSRIRACSPERMVTKKATRPASRNSSWCAGARPPVRRSARGSR